jgi:hypothetical protein
VSEFYHPHGEIRYGLNFPPSTTVVSLESKQADFMADKRKITHRSIPWITAEGLVKAMGIYSILVISLISVLVLASDAADNQKAVIKMALGLILIWIILGGSIMYRFRDPVRTFILRIRLPWQVKFLVFCTLLALLEEAVTVAMTNLARLSSLLQTTTCTPCSFTV